MNQGAKGSRAKPELLQVDYSVPLDCNRLPQRRLWALVSGENMLSKCEEKDMPGF